jgi:hypothetical protein
MLISVCSPRVRRVACHYGSSSPELHDGGTERSGSACVFDQHMRVQNSRGSHHRTVTGGAIYLRPTRRTVVAISDGGYAEVRMLP